MENISLKIGDFLGFCDMNGIEAITSDRVQELEEYVSSCQEAAREGTQLVPDSIYDKLMEILRQVNPESELCKYIWEDSVDELTDMDSVFKNNPMYSIQTVKSFDCSELSDYISRLPDKEVFDGHISAKLNGHGIRLIYCNGTFTKARSRARTSAGRDITKQLSVIMKRDGTDVIDDLSEVDICEVRGEWVLPFANLDTARSINPDIKSAFTAVSSMGKDSGSEDEWGLLDFVAYEFLSDGVTFSSKDEEYSYLEELGFKVPYNTVITDLTKADLLEALKSTVEDCEADIKRSEDNEGYEYYTDGLVFTINNTRFFKSLGDDGGHYKYGNIALKVGYWKQDMYVGYVQTILWMKGKTKFTPVAIVAEEPDMIEFEDLGEHAYITDKSDIANYNKLGVVTASGNRVRRVPLYEPNNIMLLSAYVGEPINFRYGGEAGVVPCYSDGTLLTAAKVKSILGEEDDDYEYDMEWDEETGTWVRSLQ